MHNKNILGSTTTTAATTHHGCIHRHSIVRHSDWHI